METTTRSPLQEAAMSRRAFAVGDIHGCYDALLEVLDWIEAQAPEGADVYFLGDYVDRGLKSREVLELVRAGPRRPQDHWYPISGNHEYMMLNAIEHPYAGVVVEYWLENGGQATAHSFDGKDPPKDLLDWVESLPFFYETQHHIFVHAAAPPKVHPSKAGQNYLQWHRDWEDDFPSTDFIKHIVYGHQPRREVFIRPHCTGLDTGAVYGLYFGQDHPDRGGVLTAAEFDLSGFSGPVQIFQVAVRKVV